MNTRYGAWRTGVQRGVMALLMALVALSPAFAAERKVLVMGDSLSAAYNLAPEQGWVALLGKKLQASHPGWTVANASISGETTAGGASRIAAELARHQPAVVVIELGANDGLRGLRPQLLADNLQAMIATARESGARVLLIGMQMPPNYGPAYTRRFAQTYADVARNEDVALVPFLLEGFADRPELFLADGIHPNAEAQALVLETVWQGLEPLLAPRHTAKRRAER